MPQNKRHPVSQSTQIGIGAANGDRSSTGTARSPEASVTKNYCIEFWRGAERILKYEPDEKITLEEARHQIEDSIQDMMMDGHGELPFKNVLTFAAADFIWDIQGSPPVPVRTSSV